MLSVVAVAAAVALAVGGWFLYWDLSESATNRRTGIVNDSVGRQQALTSQVQRQVAEVRRMQAQPPSDATAAQIVAVTDDLCATAEQLTGQITLTGSTQQFIDQECPS
jgi:type II secretory pathway component PulM